MRDICVLVFNAFPLIQNFKSFFSFLLFVYNKISLFLCSLCFTFIFVGNFFWTAECKKKKMRNGKKKKNYIKFISFTKLQIYTHSYSLLFAQALHFLVYLNRKNIIEELLHCNMVGTVGWKLFNVIKYMEILKGNMLSET